LIHSYLFGVESTDPPTVAAAALLLLSIAGLAAWIPARRAAALEPMTILRQE
jgi:putative ABC transport system permease protein